ncbi:hypothetical protein M422DRAFT_180023, partial [Sphaerobolus stellatus SS14]
FIEGKPGCGKTYLIDAIASWLRSQGHIALVVEFSELAATLYEHGRTAHSMFNIPVQEVSANIINTLQT